MPCLTELTKANTVFARGESPVRPAVVTKICRPDRTLTAALERFSTPTLHEVLGQRGAMSSEIKPLYPEMKVFGPAVTVSAPPGDNLIVHRALTVAEAGDVLVVDVKGYREAGHWGDIMTVAAVAQGVAGLVISGAVRDGASIRKLGFPIFALTTSMKGTSKQLPGQINVPIVCGGVVVEPGDLVAGDEDGVVVIPQKELAEVLAAAEVREQKEGALRAKLREGATTIELLGLEEALRRAGID